MAEGRVRGEYQAPALDKGLEIVELLAQAAEPLAMADIATALGRSRNEIYRMLVVLERRGYLERSSDDRFRMANRLFALAMSAPPLRNLHDAALPIMHRLAERLFQSCHLAVRSGDETVVVARVESPDLLGFAVRVGYRRPALLTTSGRLFYVSLPDPQAAAWLEQLRGQAASAVDLERFLNDCDRIREKSYHVGPSVAVDAITDLGVAIHDGVTEGAAAVLIVPFVSGRTARVPLDEALAEVITAGKAISQILRHG